MKGYALRAREVRPAPVLQAGVPRLKHEGADVVVVVEPVDRSAPRGVPDSLPRVAPPEPELFMCEPFLTRRGGGSFEFCEWVASSLNIIYVGGFGEIMILTLADAFSNRLSHAGPTTK